MVNSVYTVLFVILCLMVNRAQAEEPVQEILARVPFYAIDYTLNQDGSFSEDRAWETKVLHEKALEDVKQLTISYSTSIETAKVIDAYTLKANGKKIKVSIATRNHSNKLQSNLTAKRNRNKLPINIILLF
ncbi:DUF3857 domain-containing protein [Methylomonas sp. AM2-LC]|uniref:DUF3857 domain-containing protein n=1 Tax=Methylomonas sp. AM2-LC TaxID=3153301 RepID=UPI003267136B